MIIGEERSAVESSNKRDPLKDWFPADNGSTDSREVGAKEGTTDGRTVDILVGLGVGLAVGFRVVVGYADTDGGRGGVGIEVVADGVEEGMEDNGCEVGWLVGWASG